MFPTTHTHQKAEQRLFLERFWEDSIPLRAPRGGRQLEIRAPKTDNQPAVVHFFFKEQINQNTRVVQKTKQERKKSHKLHKSDPNYSNVPFCAKTSQSEEFNAKKKQSVDILHMSSC